MNIARACLVLLAAALLAPASARADEQSARRPGAHPLPGSLVTGLSYCTTILRGRSRHDRTHIQAV